MSAGLRDVARRAGVSPGTVSNYLNHPWKVAPETALRIADAIRELDYVTNGAASVLRRGSNPTIGHVTIELGNPFFASVAAGAQARAEESGYRVLVGNTGGSPEREEAYLRLFESQRVSGLLISSAHAVHKRVRVLVERGFPLVVMDQSVPTDLCSSVVVDDVKGGRLAVDHLASLGHRRLSFVGGPLSIDTVAHRLTGARESAGAHAVRVEVIETPERTIAVGRAVGEELADRPDGQRPTAILAANDLLAVGVLHGLLQRGLRVPDDVSLVGYDDIDFAADAVVPLTTVRRPAEQFGRTALDLLIARMTATARPENISLSFDPELVVRRSTGPPAGR